MIGRFTSLLCIVLGVLSQADGLQFYAYGRGINGLPLFYSDGMAYIGLISPSNATTSANVTLVAENADDGSFVASPVNTTTTIGNWTLSKLYIDNTSGAFASVGFSSSDNSSLTTTGFDLWGTMLIWVSATGEITTKWYADPVDDDIWSLKWNTNNTASDSAVPVVLKTLAPEAKKARK